MSVHTSPCSAGGIAHAGLSRCERRLACAARSRRRHHAGGGAPTPRRPDGEGDRPLREESRRDVRPPLRRCVHRRGLQVRNPGILRTADWPFRSSSRSPGLLIMTSIPSTARCRPLLHRTSSFKDETDYTAMVRRGGPESLLLRRGLAAIYSAAPSKGAAMQPSPLSAAPSRLHFLLAGLPKARRCPRPHPHSAIIYTIVTYGC